MNKIRRYPGAQPFSINQQSEFFGREKDIEEVINLLSFNAGTTTTIFSRSGYGKTSLINAGIIPRLLHDDVQVITIRTGTWQDQTGIDLSSAIANQIKSWATFSSGSVRQYDNLWHWLEKYCPPNSWWLWLKRAQLGDGDKVRRVVLVFDLLEEIFSYPQEEIETAARLLAEALYRRLPPGLSDELYSNSLGPAPVTTLDPEHLKMLYKPLEVQTLFAIRSDRLSYLDRLKHFHPTILQNIYELRPFTVLNARDALEKPAALRGDYQSPSFEYSKDAQTQIFYYLSKGDSKSIEPFQLQIIGSYAENLVLKTGKRLLESHDFGDFNDIYEYYYERSLEDLPYEDQQQARRLIEEGLVFEEEQRRLSLYEGQIHKMWGVSQEMLRRLVDSHLLRAEPSRDGGYTYELSHDTLVAPVLKSKARRLEEERRMREEMERLQKERHRSRRYSLVIGLLATLCVILAIFVMILLRR